MIDDWSIPENKNINKKKILINIVTLKKSLSINSIIIKNDLPPTNITLSSILQIK